MKKPLLILAFLLFVFKMSAQLNCSADKALYLNLLKVGPFSLSQNEHANAVGLPLGGGFAAKIKQDWSFDLHIQYGVLGSALTTRYARKDWFDLQLGFQKELYSLFDEKLIVRSNFGGGYYNLQTLKKGSFGTEVRGISFGPYLHLGCVLNYNLAKRVVLYNKIQIRATAMSNVSSYDVSFFNGQAASSVFYKRTDLDFGFVPFEFGISYNFYSTDEP